MRNRLCFTIVWFIVALFLFRSIEESMVKHSYNAGAKKVVLKDWYSLRQITYFKNYNDYRVSCPVEGVCSCSEWRLLKHERKSSDELFKIDYETKMGELTAQMKGTFSIMYKDKKGNSIQRFWEKDPI